MTGRYAEAIRLVAAGEANGRVTEAVELWRQGLNGVEIAERMGISRSYAYGLLADPTGAKTKARKRKVYALCVGCQKRIYNAGSVPGKRCLACDAAYRCSLSRQWILDGFAEWVELYGQPPCAYDWCPAPSTLARLSPETARRVRAAHRDRAWPGPSHVANHFGSWSAGLRAAGLEPLKSGQRRDPETWYWHRHGGMG
ncbi:MAG: hypothetical protein ACRDLD_02300 [Thermoleophilaceae bacterium]